MNDDTTKTDAPLSVSDIAKALRNESYGTFILGDKEKGLYREFEIKDLRYDDYIEFVSLATPILQAVFSSLEVKSAGGEVGLDFNPLSLDFKNLLALAGKELPRMAWLVCKQSDPKIKLEDVKDLARRPTQMLEIVLKQVLKNKMVQEFADFFPRMTQVLSEIAPEVGQAMRSIPAGETTPSA